MGLLIRQPGTAPLLLVGDLSYDIHLLDEEHVPGAGDRARMLETTRRVNELRRRMPGLVVLAAHDPGAADALRGALKDRMGA
jgi:glyoxylase-like metal-dependent hydrolase (beta-lactamase superfamily II)